MESKSPSPANAGGLAANLIMPLKPAQQSSPIKKRLRMGGLNSGVDVTTEPSSGNDNGGEEYASGTGCIVDRVPALPKFNLGASENNKMATADNSSISTTVEAAAACAGSTTAGPAAAPRPAEGPIDLLKYPKH